EYRKIDGHWYQIEHGREFQVDEEVITVKFRGVVNEEQIVAFNNSQDVQALRTNILGFTDLRIPGNADPLKLIEAYQNSGLVEIAEANTFGEYLGVPNDPKFSDQWHHKHSQDHDIDTPKAWNLETGTPSVIIGVLDSGTDILHEDLEGNIWVNPGEDIDNDGVVWDTGDINGVDDDGNGKVDDLVGWDFYHGNNNVVGPIYHGTWVAGIAAAVTNNDTGVAGVAGGWGSSSPGAKMLICAVGDYTPSSSVVDDAILYAVSKNAKIINMSFTVGESAAINAAIGSAYLTYGAFIVAASGNDGVATVGYPARAQYVVGVGATNTSDQRASFSNYGSALDVVAPGVDIWSTKKNNTYGSASGTSAAAPQVSGIGALLKSYNSSFTNAQIEERIAEGA
ncbi:MAG: S8 family serine peptidase, partial [Calditrichaeota bacterium]|nr:S8 family serine peptidase [Calditrichota bacterium]